MKDRISSAVIEAQVKALYDRNYLPALAGIPFAAFLAWIFRDLFEQRTLIIGLGLKSLTALLRLLAGHLFASGRTHLADKSWATLYISLLAADAIVWSGLAAFFIPAGRPEFIAGTTAIIVGIASVGASTLSSYFSAHLAFSSLLLLPSALFVLSSGNHIFNQVSAGSLLVFYLLILIDGRRAAREFERQITLRLMLDDSVAALQESEGRWKALYEHTPVPTYVWEERNSDWVLISLNKAAQNFSGEKSGELLGQRVSDFFYDRPAIRGAFAECRKSGVTKQENINMRISSGAEKTLHITYGFIPEKYIIVMTEDITESMRVETALRQSLREKEILLAEVHHRVKNNLQILGSLISMQSQLTRDSNSLVQLGSLALRIRAMGMLHTKLYQSPSLARVDMRDYLGALAEEIISVNQSLRNEVALKIDIPEVYLNMETSLPLGLIANELISNSMKYAFASQERPEIHLSLRQSDARFIFTVTDNGCGMDFNELADNTLGLRLVQALSRQLHGELKVTSETGVSVMIAFEEQKKEEVRWAS